MISVVIDALLEMGSRLLIRELLVKKYGLAPSPSPYAQAGAARTDTLDGLQSLFTGNGDWLLRRNELLRRNDNEYNTIKRLSWSVKEKPKFEKLVSELRLLNDGLEAITLSFAQRKAQEIYMIQALPTTRDRLDSIGGNLHFSELFRAAATFKAQNSAGAPRPSIDLALRQQDFVLTSSTTSFELVRSTSGGSEERWVLIENKQKLPTELGATMKVLVEQRLKDLAALLHQRPKPYGYRVLDMVGYIKGPQNSQISWKLAFELPPSCRSSGVLPGFKILRDLFLNASNNSSPKVPLLGDRFRLAQYIATCVLSLHLTGWLHRSLTSSNILCFSPDASQTSYSNPYLQGFAYARADDPMEISEVERSDNTKLYSHPRHQAGEKYRRSFEYYSLGIILLEIGWWRKIEAFYESTYTPEQFQRRLLRTYTDPLGHSMGESYRDAVRLCLTGQAAFGVGDNEDRQLTQVFFQKVVRVLDTESV